MRHVSQTIEDRAALVAGDMRFLSSQLHLLPNFRYVGREHVMQRCYRGFDLVTSASAGWQTDRNTGATNDCGGATNLPSAVLNLSRSPSVPHMSPTSGSRLVCYGNQNPTRRLRLDVPDKSLFAPVLQRMGFNMKHGKMGSMAGWRTHRLVAANPTTPFWG
ncbi:hypothetical protein OH77DRAFT_142908 [Trametes cingulata]|nr:hypothetical protein OH77DRAFT_142908 [Trametes cingulata]